ncbi:MAG TPA: hypothetical protein VJ757_14840 [Pseudonocardiaceae bacterium]|nr:hypothetical protein [Pseudonocardiaceae bacterium]
MGLLDKLRDTFGSGVNGSDDQRGVQHQAGASGQDPDEVAVERYRYMLRTAPPETMEQAHAEAFAKLTPDQRRKVLQDLGNTVPAAERATSDDPQSLARMATRAEMRQPGTMERVLGGGRGGMGMGGVIAGSLLASVAGAFVGTAIADAFLGDELGGDAMAGGEDMAVDDPGVDPGMDDFGGMDGFGI